MPPIFIQGIKVPLLWLAVRSPIVQINLNMTPLPLHVLFLSLASGEKIEVLNFFGTGIKDHGAIRSAQLVSGADLRPGEEAVTICSSIYMRSFIMEQSLFQVRPCWSHGRCV